MAAGLYAPRGIEMAYERTGPVTRGKLCEVGRLALRARYQTRNLHLFFFFFNQSKSLYNPPWSKDASVMSLQSPYIESLERVLPRTLLQVSVLGITKLAGFHGDPHLADMWPDQVV